MGWKGKGPKRLTQEQFFALYKAGPETIYSLIDYLQETNRQLLVRLQEIERQLKMNSHNSSKPPSSDGMIKFSSRKRENPRVESQAGKKVMKEKH